LNWNSTFPATPFMRSALPSARMSIVTVTCEFTFDCGNHPITFEVERASVLNVTPDCEPMSVPTPPPGVAPSFTKIVVRIPPSCENESPKIRLSVPATAVPVTPSSCRNGSVFPLLSLT
jgi:hypothetical protein